MPKYTDRYLFVLLSFDLVWKPLQRGVRFGKRRGLLFSNMVHTTEIRESCYFIDNSSAGVGQPAQAKLSFVKAFSILGSRHLSRNLVDGI